ncbi:MAG: asparagine synthase (glutamine-hydrolyzing) [Candidatus Omnitrophica bacterium]|nr:asparagine synthase (glutamine-hydrolyzing) [Candidatus Omnitrophota bacterium]
MCGLCGFVDFGNWDRDEALVCLKKMNETLVHRGPDDEGFYIDGSAGLAHKRLSILDLSQHGRQPMPNEDGNVRLIFNGEIYNFLELRQEMIKKGHSFISRTDSEVIIHLYEEFGEECFKMLDGMFALAIWDRGREKLFLARDPIGKKPLHYAVIGNAILFGSEIKSILKHPMVSRHLSRGSLCEYLFLGYIPGPGTVFKDIKKLAGGHFLVFDRDGCRVKQYWDLSCPGRDSTGEEEVVQTFMELFRKSVEKRLTADVPIGVFLSGGIDSSCVAFLMAQLSRETIKTFSIGFEDDSYDELKFAREMAHLTDSDHYEEVLNSSRMLEVLPSVIKGLDEPLADASIIPTYLVSSIARKEVKVVLSGDGGDELFAGYPTFIGHRLMPFYKRIPHPIRSKIIRPLIERIPASGKNISLNFMAKRFVQGAPYSYEVRHHIWMSYFNFDEIKALLSPDVVKDFSMNGVLSEITSFLKVHPCHDIFDELLLLNMRFYLQDDILVKVDRASMASSLEVRSPFLDKGLVEFVNNLPFCLKMKGFKTKHILKKAFKGLLPGKILYRRKQGFSVPIAKWLKGEMRDVLMSVLNPDSIQRHGLFNYSFIEKLLKDHMAGKRDNSRQIWALFIFQSWYENYGG